MNKLEIIFRSLPLFIIASIAGTWMILMNPGMFWDDWVWVFQSSESNHQIGLELGVWWSGYVNDYVYGLKDSVFFLRCLALVGWSIGTLAFTLAIKKLLALTSRDTIEIAALILASQACLIRFLNSAAFYNIYFMAFWLGVAIFVYCYSSRYLRLLAIPFFFFSYYLNSFIVVYLGGVLALFVIYLLQRDHLENPFIPQKDLLKNLTLKLKKIVSYRVRDWISCIQTFILEFNIFLFLPFIFFFITKLLTVESKLYGTYNKVDSGLIFGSLFKAIPLFFKSIKAYFLLYNHVPIAWVLFFAIIIYLVSLLLLKESPEFTWPKLVKKYLLALILFIFSIAPYLIVKKPPDLLDFYESRHGLIAIPAIILFIQASLDLIQKLLTKWVRRVNTLRNIVFAMLMGYSLAASNVFAMNLWGDWIRQSAIMNYLDAHQDTLKPVNLFVMYDFSTLMIGKRSIYNYEYTGNVHQIFTGQNRFAISSKELGSWPANVPLVQEPELKKRFLINDFQFSEETSIVNLTIQNTDKQFKKHEFIRLAKDIAKGSFVIEPEKYVQVSAISVANTSGHLLIELKNLQEALYEFKSQKGYFPRQSFDLEAKTIPSLTIHGLRPDASAPLPIYGNIPELFPKFMERPIAMQSSNPSATSYIYISDGTEFKLVLSNAPETFFIKQSHPEMMDPLRGAFGYWTSGAKYW